MKVHRLKPKDLRWSFDAEPPFYWVGVRAGHFGTSVKVDPSPCYAADLGLVEEMVAECEERAPLTGAGASDLYILSHEFLGRTNAWTDQGWCYDLPKTKALDKDGNEEECYPQAHTICISGKRIPIMPSMLRYLVAHEYGHAVFNHVAHHLGRSKDSHKLEDEYMRARGAKIYRGTYAGGGWHRTASEIVANDFRVLVMEREREFWPHEVPRPKWSSPTGRWWKRALEICRLGRMP